MKVRKRDGSVVEFDGSKITTAIFKAAESVGGTDHNKAQEIADQVLSILTAEEKINAQRYTKKAYIVDVEHVQDVVEKVLIEDGHAKTAKAYILYREKRRQAREQNALVGATINMFDQYLQDDSWLIKENANASYSIGGLNHFVRETFTKAYWLENVYSKQVRDAHTSGDVHIHDLGFFGAYCAGWDLRYILMNGYGGVNGSVRSRPPKHLRSFLGQVVNSTFSTQMETAGAQAWSSIDTYCAPFIRYDNLDFHTVKQILQEFVHNLNVPTRVSCQTPFSNLTFDLKCPNLLKDTPVICGGIPTDDVYGDFQAEMDMFNKAYFEVMMEGDADGRIFTFPIPTINVTREFDWDNPVVDTIMEATNKYGAPYFSNYVNSDLSPEDSVSMCCRLRLDMTELRKRGGGLFGSNPMTGSINVYTINMPRIGYLSESKEDYKARLRRMMEIGKEQMELKRKILEREIERGLYPFCKMYLTDTKVKYGEYWYNHFNTIGIVGMNESLLNFFGKNISTPEGQEFAVEIMNFMRDILKEFQTETGHVYNLEATPAESTSYRLAMLDKKKYPDIITAGTDHSPYYTNSTHLPVNFSDDVFETLDLQDELQSLYTGGTILHMYLGESIKDINTTKMLIQRVFTNYRLPYISITPTFSICKTHGYINGEHFTCPTCNSVCEVYTRVTGYYRPVQNFNTGKAQEYRDRLEYDLTNGE